MGNSQQSGGQGQRVEVRNKRSFNPNSNKKVRASSALQSQTSAYALESGAQSKGTANFGFSPNQFVQSQIMNSYTQPPTFTNNKVVSQSVSPINKINISNNQGYMPTNQGQDNMLGLTPRTFQRANDLNNQSNLANYYNNLTSQIAQAPNKNQSIHQSNALDRSQIHSGANTVVLNKYYNGKNQRSKQNFVVNKYFDGQLIDQNVLNNISQTHLNKTHTRVDTSFNTSISARKERQPMSERILNRRYSDNSVATFQQQIEAFTRRSIRERKRKYKKYENQDNFLKAMEFSADYKLCANLFTGSSQTLVQPSILVFNQDLLQPFQPNSQNQKDMVISQKTLELQLYLQFLNDTENNSISNVDFIQLAKEKKEDEDLKLIQYIRQQQKLDTKQLKHPSRLNQQLQEKQNKQIQNYFESKSELPNRDFANMIDEQFRKASQQQDKQKQTQPNQFFSSSHHNIFDTNKSDQNTNPSFSQNLTNNSKNLHQIQMQLFEQQSKNIKEQMNQQNQSSKVGLDQPKDTFYQRQLTLGKIDQGDDHHITEDEWNKLANPLHDNSEKQLQDQNINRQKQKAQNNLNNYHDGDNNSDDDDEKYIKVDLDNQNQNFNNQNNPFANNTIQNQNGFSNMSSIIMNTSQQSEQNGNIKEDIQKQNEDKSKNQKKYQNQQQNNQQSVQNGPILSNSQKNLQHFSQSVQQKSKNQMKNQNNQTNSSKDFNQNNSYQIDDQKSSKIPIKIIGLHMPESDEINSLDQFNEIQSEEILDHNHENNHSPKSHHSQDDSQLRESQISVVSDEEKMLHFQNQLKMQQQQQQQYNSNLQNQKNGNENNNKPQKTTHFLPNFQFNHLPNNTKGTIIVDQKNNQSLIQSNLNQQQDFDKKKKNQNSFKSSPGNDYNSEANESLYQDVHKLEQEEHIRRLALKKAEEEYDMEIRKKEIEMMLLDKRIEQKKETNFQNHRNKQFRMDELAKKHYQELKNQIETNDYVDRIVDQSLNKNQIEGFVKRYQNTTLNTTNTNGKGNQSSFNQSLVSNQISQKKFENTQNSGDKYKSSYMNTNQYQSQHKKKRNMQVDSYKQTLFHNQNYPQSNQSSAEKKQESVFNSKFYQENEQQLVKNIMNQNIFKKEDQENQQKNVSDYYLQKLKQGQQQKEKEKQEQLIRQQKQIEEQQKNYKNQKLGRMQSEESQQYHHEGQGIDNLDLFQDFDEAESQHQDHDENEEDFAHDHDRLTENEDEYAENSDDSMDNYHQQNKPIELKMDLNYFKKNRRHSSEINEEEEEEKSVQKSGRQQNQAEVIPIQIDIKDFIKKKTENNKNTYQAADTQNNFYGNNFGQQQRSKQDQSQTQNLVQSVKDNLNKVNNSNNKLAQTQQFNAKRRDSENSPISARGSIPGFGDRKNSESEGESILKSITQQVMKLKGRIEKDKVNLDQSNIEYQTKIASKVINTLNNSKDGTLLNYTEDLINNSNLLHPSSSNKILNQVSSQKNIGSQNEIQQTQKSLKPSSNIQQNQSLNNSQLQQNTQQQQFQYQQKSSQPILININPTTPTASQKSLQAPGNDSKISQRSQTNQQSQMNSNHTSNQQTPRNNYNLQNNNYNQQGNTYQPSPNTLADPNQSIPLQFNKAVSEYDYESQSQFGSFPNDEKTNKRVNIVKTLYVDQKQQAPSPSDQKLGYDAAMAKRQNTLLMAINSQVEHSDQSQSNKPQSQLYSNVQQDRRQSTNSQLSIHSNVKNLQGNEIESQQYIQKVESKNQLPSNINSLNSLDLNVKQISKNTVDLNNFQNNNLEPNHVEPIQLQHDQDEYFENQPAQFQQYSSPLIDQSIVRKPSFTKPRSSKFQSNLNSESNNQKNFFFDMPEDTLGNTALNDVQQFDQNHPEIKKQSSGFSYHSNSFYAMNSQKSSVSNKQLQKNGGNNSQRPSNAGLDFFNFPSQGQTSSHQQIPTSSKQSIAEKLSVHSQVENGQRRSSQQNYDFFQYPSQNNNNKPKERNSYLFDDKNNHENNYFQHRQSDHQALDNQKNDPNLHQYESNDYVNQANYNPHQYQYHNHEDDQNGGFDFDAFAEAQ